MDYKEILNETRAVFSRHRGRIFRKVDPRDLVLPTNSRDEMVVRVGADQKQLLKSGKVVWAALIQANFQMYVKRVHSRGGEVLCSLDPHFDAHPRELQAIASTLFSFKGKEKVPRVLQRIVADIRNERVRQFGTEIPGAVCRKFTTGQPVQWYSIPLQRDHLPDGVLCGELLPVLQHPAGGTG